jgi:hypothetical protein
MFYRQQRTQRICKQLREILRSESEGKDVEELVSSFEPFMLILCEYLHGEIDLSFLHDTQTDEDAHESVENLLQAGKDHLNQIKDALMFEPDWIGSGGLTHPRRAVDSDSAEDTFLQVFEEWKSASTADRDSIISNFCRQLPPNDLEKITEKGCMNLCRLETLFEISSCEEDVCQFFKDIEAHLGRDE